MYVEHGYTINTQYNVFVKQVSLVVTLFQPRAPGFQSIR